MSPLYVIVVTDTYPQVFFRHKQVLFSMARRRKALPKDPVAAQIDDLTHDGRGVAHLDGKTVFIDQALPGEKIHFTYTNRRRQYDEGHIYSIDDKSSIRINPGCPHFGICGGCSLQHISHDEQIKLKQKILLDNLQRIGHVSPGKVRDPITGPVWGYRRKARLGVKLVHKKNRVLVGFREKSSRYLADLAVCKVLHPSVGEKLSELGQLVMRLSIPASIPQIEVAVGDTTTALVFRHLEPLSGNDKEQLIDFAKLHCFDIYLQPGGPQTVELLWPEHTELYYALSAYNLRYDFKPGDFVQVNTDINNQMVAAVLEAIDIKSSSNILELFCGLGNFTLPLAKYAASVTAVEGEATLIERAREIAAQNSISNVTYHVANLMDDTSGLPWWKSQMYERIFLDPPRSGAIEVLPAIANLKVERIVYVSCNPATLARDAGYLVNECKYTLEEAGIMDMFPHTSHVESIAIFTRI